MFTVTVRFYLTAGGLIAIIGILLRLSWQFGGIIEAFRHHVKEAAETFSKHDSRITYLERRRR